MNQLAMIFMYNPFALVIIAIGLDLLTVLHKYYWQYKSQNLMYILIQIIKYFSIQTSKNIMKIEVLDILGSSN